VRKAASAVRRVFFLTVIGSIGLLILGMWPGSYPFDFPFFCISVPLLGFWFMLLVWFGVRELVRQRDPNSNRQQWGLLSLGVMSATITLLLFHVPQRFGCLLCYGDLSQLVDKAPVGFRGAKINMRAGPYLIDRYGADKRGGVFFRTATGLDGIGPDEMSYGFAFRPNAVGTPFGESSYSLSHLFGDWYSFSVSDD